MPETQTKLTPAEETALARGDMVMMESLRSFTLQTTKGHACHFEARVPRLVPKIIAKDAMAAGCAPVNRDDAPFIDDTSKSKVEFDKPLRRAILMIAIDSLVTENDISKFDGGSLPKLEVISEMTGIDVSKKEMGSLYNEYRMCKRNDNDLPAHPDAAKVYAIVQATTKDDLVELGVEAGYPKARVKGMQTRDLRRLLLTKFSLAQLG